MPRPRHGEPTALGAAVHARRATRSLDDVGAEVGLTTSTLSRVERGTHTPSVATARALARWLGWTVDQVLDAADTPAAPPPDLA